MDDAKARKFLILNFKKNIKEINENIRRLMYRERDSNIINIM